jgi:hypothetical protein
MPRLTGAQRPRRRGAPNPTPVAPNHALTRIRRNIQCAARIPQVGPSRKLQPSGRFRPRRRIAAASAALHSYAPCQCPCVPPKCHERVRLFSRSPLDQKNRAKTRPERPTLPNSGEPELRRQRFGRRRLCVPDPTLALLSEPLDRDRTVEI